MPPLKYLKIKEHLQTVVLEPSSSVKMPTVRELMRNFNVSLATVNRALSELENEGVIVRKQGSGIVSTRQSGEVSRLQNRDPNKGASLVLAYVDYPAENIWNMTHIIEHYLHQKDFRVVTCKIYKETTMEMVAQFVWQQEDCCGLILIPGAGRLSLEDLTQLGYLDMPVTLLDSMYFYQELPKNIYIVSPDPEYSGQLEVETLLRRGHKNIGYIRNEPVSEYGDLKLKAITAALHNAGVAFGPENIFSATIRPWESSLDAALAITEKNIAAFRKMNLTALIYTSSPGALAAIRPLTKAGLRVPQDISLISEGDLHVLRYLTPQLTVTVSDFVEICCRAADVVVGEEKPKSRIIKMPHRLIERESIADLNIFINNKRYVGAEV